MGEGERASKSAGSRALFRNKQATKQGTRDANIPVARMSAAINVSKPRLSVAVSLRRSSVRTCRVSLGSENKPLGL